MFSQVRNQKQFIANFSFKKQFDKQRELTEEIIDIWSKAEAMEEVRIRSIKSKCCVCAYTSCIETIFSIAKNDSSTNSHILSSKMHGDALLQVLEKTNEEFAASSIYKFKCMLSEEDFKSCIKLDQSLGTKVDFDEVSLSLLPTLSSCLT